METTASATSSQTTPTLPSKFRVPPLPPRIHRRLVLQPIEEGLVVRPARDDAGESILITWGTKGTIRRHIPDQDVGSDAESLQIGGILGITRLWATAYLLVFLDSTAQTKAIKIFPAEEKRSFPALPLKTPSVVEEGDPLLDRLRAIAEREGILPPSPTTESPGGAGRDWKGLFRPGLATTNGDGGADASTGQGTPGSEEEEQEGTAQGTVFELRNVYAVPLTKVGAEGLISQVKGAVAKVSRDRRLTFRLIADSCHKRHVRNPPLRHRVRLNPRRRVPIDLQRRARQQTRKRRWKRLRGS